MKKFMYFAAALLVLVGCNKNSQTNKENAPQEVVTIKGGIVLPQTPNKIAPAEGWQTATEPFQMLWEEGDQIYIWNQAAPDNGQIFTLIDGAGTTEGTFSGTKLEDMSDYFVSNIGQTRLGEYTVEYVENNFRHPYISGTGNEGGFSIYNFGAVLGLPLKGDVTLSKIEVEIDLGGGMITKFTMPFSEDGLTLNNTTATKVYIPVDAPGEIEKETIRFYVGDEVIMSKTLSEAKENLPGCNKVTTFPELVIPTYVDLGLSVKWATFNVGATTPEGYGDYFAWGETAPYYNTPITDPITWKEGKTGYSWQSYCGQSSFSEWNPAPYDDYMILKPEYDAANVNWGGNWRMPTKEEQDELRNTDNCTWEWKTNYNGTGVNGSLVTSKKNGNSIFLPASGYRHDSSLSNVGSNGVYWSSSIYEYDSDRAFYLYFDSGSVVGDRRDRYYGRSVRPVYNVVVYK